MKSGIKRRALNAVASFSHGYRIVFGDSEYTGLFFVNLGISVLSAMMSPVFPLWIVDKLHAPAAVVFRILTIAGASGALIGIVIGRLADRMPRRSQALQGILLVSALQGLLYLVFPYLPVIAVVTAITKFPKGSLPFAILKDRIYEKRDVHLGGSITSSVRTSASLGFMIGPMLGVTLYSLISFRIFFASYSALSVILILVVRLTVRGNTTVSRANPAFSEGHSHSARQHIVPTALGTILVVFLGAGTVASGPLLAIHTQRIAGDWAVGTVFGIGPIIEIFIFPFVGLLVDKIALHRTLILGSVAGVLYFLILFSSNMIFVVFAAQVVGAFYSAIVFSGLMMFLQRLYAGQAGFSSSMFFSVLSISGILSNLLLGAVVSTGSYRIGFLLFGVSCSVAILLILMIRWTSVRSAS